jgi:hypothetical protein
VCLSDTSWHFAAVFLNRSEQMTYIRASVAGVEIDTRDLSQQFDEKAVVKVHCVLHHAGLLFMSSVQAYGIQPGELNAGSLLHAVTTRIAVRDS